MDSDNKLFLLDAYALIYRAYYAFIKNPQNQLQRIQHFSHSRVCEYPRRSTEKRESHSYRSGFRPRGPTFRHEAFRTI